MLPLVQVATIVVTSHGPRHAKDSTATNHYSTLSSIQQALGPPCLANTRDTANVTPLAKLLAVTGSARWPPPCVDAVTDNNDPVVLQGTPDGNWVSAGAPAPGSGSNLPGAITTVSGHLWLAGTYDDGNSRLPLIEHR